MSIDLTKETVKGQKGDFTRYCLKKSFNKGGQDIQRWIYFTPNEILKLAEMVTTEAAFLKNENKF